jgi:hypothetical protein
LIFAGGLLVSLGQVESNRECQIAEFRFRRNLGDDLIEFDLEPGLSSLADFIAEGGLEFD